MTSTPTPKPNRLLLASAVAAGIGVRALRVGGISVLAAACVAGGLGARFGWWVAAVVTGLWLGAVDVIRDHR